MRGAGARAVKEERLGPIEWSPVQEATARGAAALAGVGGGSAVAMPEPRVAVVGSLNLDLVAEVAAAAPPAARRCSPPARAGPWAARAPTRRCPPRATAWASRWSAASAPTRRARASSDALLAEGIDVSGVAARDDAATGVAHIAVDAEGRNTIVVVSGANAALDAGDVHRALGLLPAADVILLQLEIPLDAVIAAAADRAATCRSSTPRPRESSRRAAAACRRAGPERARARRADRRRRPDARGHRRGAPARSRDGMAVVVTMGEAGALVVDGDGETHVPAPRVDAIDTTGAGDAFCGSLAAGLARGRSLVDAVSRAVRIGSLSTLRHGALESFPTAAEIAA